VRDRGVGRGEQLARQEVTEWVEVTRPPAQCIM
jgi:hypothetical protein